MKLAIKGHAERGNEVIEILEILGGYNANNHYGNHCDKVYYINENGYIDWDFIFRIEQYTKFIIFSLEEFLEKFPYKVGDKVSSKYLKNYKIVKMEWEDTNNRVIYKLQGMGWYNSDELEYYKEETMEEKLMPRIDLTRYCKDKYIIALGNYKIQEENGVTYAIRKKPQYPKTYKECCDVLGLSTMDNDAKGYKGDLIIRFQELLIARDAYWKIAGEQMGLGKPWEPDWTDNYQKKWTINFYQGEINFTTGPNVQFILAFPTEEMRDAFYENFKELIEQCKELL